jgi:TonB-linked SusC/RagA family outer membrane protein
MRKIFTYLIPEQNKSALCTVRYLVLLLAAMCWSLSGFSQSATVSGIVSDKVGPLPGVTVTVRGTKTSTSTDSKGAYTIKVPNKDAVLVFTSVGYQAQEIAVTSKTTISLTLVENVSDLNEVVVLGYGSSRRSDVTGSVGTVKMEDLVRAPVATADQALAGRIAGVQVISADGQPGGVADIAIRGTGSITQSAGPLYVIDGFPQEASAFSTLNPNDIESLTVLKDASSTAIYGARGANGVIVITTKKGKSGTPKINLTGFYGTQAVMKKLKLMDAYDFVRLQNDISSAFARQVYFTNGRTLDYYRTAESIDWQDKTEQIAPFSNYTVSASGKSDNTNYYVSGNYVNQTGLIINSGFRRYQGRISLDQKFNDNLTVGVVANYSATKSYGNNTSTQSQGFATGTQNSPQFNLMQNIWSYRPVSSAADVDQLLNAFQDDGAGDRDLDRLNPYLLALNTVNDNYQNALQSNAYLSLKFLKNFTLRTTAGINYTTGNREYFNNQFTRGGSPLTNQGATNGMSGGIDNSSGYSFLNENTVTYDKKLSKDHHINALVGFTNQKQYVKTNSLNAIQIPNEKLGVNGIDEGTPYATSAAESENTLASFLARVNYDFKNRYFLTASMRADGSSKFYTGHRWGYFPSGAIRWKVLEEPLLKEFKSLSRLDIRASYGVTGNNRVGDYAYASPVILSGSGTGTRYSFNNTIITGAIPQKMFNPDLKWETSSMLDIGFETGILKDRITLEADYYNKKTYDLLLQSNIPTSLGYSTTVENIGNIQNSGLEISINTTNIRTKKFTWTSNFNISFNKNKVLELARNQDIRPELSASTTFSTDFASQPLYVAKVGQPVAAFYGYVYDGLYRLKDFDAIQSGTTTTYRLKNNVPYFTNATTPKPGDVKFRDLNGDGVIDANDYAVIGNPYPKHFGGFTNNFTYKNFDLSVFLQWSYGNQLFNGNRVTLEGQSTADTRGLGLNMLASYADYWTVNNDNATMPGALATAFGQRSFSSRYIEDGSYLRLKTVQFGYNLPKEILNKFKVTSARFYISGQNLLTWTKYSGPDPEVSTKQSPTTPGFDFSAYPRARVITIGANFTY